MLKGQGATCCTFIGFHGYLGRTANFKITGNYNRTYLLLHIDATVESFIHNIQLTLSFRLRSDGEIQLSMSAFPQTPSFSSVLKQGLVPKAIIQQCL